ncbi:MAG: hypothetical protein M1835_001037 [Candelina submexicana]|nr:MAG: hypothetical protein M1835_001037 [Candelina submexicana]
MGSQHYSFISVAANDNSDYAAIARVLNETFLDPDGNDGTSAPINLTHNEIASSSTNLCSPTPKSNPSEPCSFQGLPAELRNRIYAYVLTFEKDVQLVNAKTPPHLMIDTNLFRTSRLVHDEALPIFYRLNAIRINTPEEAKHFVDLPKFVANVLRVHIMAVGFSFGGPEPDQPRRGGCSIGPLQMKQFISVAQLLCNQDKRHVLVHVCPASEEYAGSWKHENPSGARPRLAKWKEEIFRNYMKGVLAALRCSVCPGLMECKGGYFHSW